MWAKVKQFEPREPGHIYMKAGRKYVVTEVTFRPDGTLQTVRGLMVDDDSEVRYHQPWDDAQGDREVTLLGEIIRHLKPAPAPHYVERDYLNHLR